MTINRDATLTLVAEQLADDLGCHAEDLTSDEVVVVPTALRQGRRRFPVAARSLQVVSMERGVVVSCDDTRLAAVHSLLAGVAPMAVLQVPLLARLHTLVADDGQNLYGPFQHAVCWPETFRPAASPPDVSIALLEGLAVAQIYHEPGFDNALEYDLAASRPDVLAATATIKGQLVGVAGVSADSDRLWQIGVDVRTPFRNSGIGTALVGRVTEAVFAAGRVPYYATPIAHLASARIALRLGYVPAWIAAYTRALRGCATPE